MTETAAPTPPADPQALAERAIGEAVGRLEQARAGSLDERLDAAEAVHAVLAEHLGGSRPPAS